MSVSSSVSTSTSTEVRERPRFKVPVRERPAQAENEVSGEIEASKEKLSAREKARLRFKQLRKGTRDSTDKFIDNLINNINTVSESPEPRRRFRPSGNRGKNFRLNFRRNRPTEAPKTTVAEPEEEITMISVSSVTSRSETELRQTGQPELVTEAASEDNEDLTTLQERLATLQQERTTLQQQRTTLPQLRTTQPDTTVVTTQRSFPALRTTPEPVTEAASTRPRKFDFSRSRLRPKLRLRTTTTQVPETTTPLPRTTEQERQTTVQQQAVIATTARPFEIRVEESAFDSFPRLQESSNFDALKRLQLIAQTKVAQRPSGRRPAPTQPSARTPVRQEAVRPAFTFPKPALPEVPTLENEIIDTFVPLSTPQGVRPAFVGVTTNLIPQRPAPVRIQVQEPREIVFDVEESIRSVEQPRRQEASLPRRQDQPRRLEQPRRQEQPRKQEQAQEQPRRTSVPARRVPEEQVLRVQQERKVAPQAFNQIQPAPEKPVFAPAKFDFPAFFSEPFAFIAFRDGVPQREPGPGSYAYSVGL